MHAILVLMSLCVEHKFVSVVSWVGVNKKATMVHEDISPLQIFRVYKPSQPFGRVQSALRNYIKLAYTPTMSKYVIEVDPRLEKSYSDDSSCFGSDTTSLASSVKDNVYEHGRRYHGWREVWLPAHIFSICLVTIIF